jgi:hypothetical protein
MFGLIAVRSDEVRATGKAVDGDFALAAATNGADFFALSRAEPLGRALFADRTGHSLSLLRRERYARLFDRDDNGSEPKAATMIKHQHYFK